MENQEFINTLTNVFELSTEDYTELLNIYSKSENEEDLSIESLDIEKEMKKDISNVKLYTGVPEIDNLTKGLKQGLHVISGFRKCCKSTFAINMIYRALNDGLNVCLLSLEMSKMEIINILLSLHSYECDSLTAINRDELLMLYELDRDKYNDYLLSFLSLKGNLFIITEKEIEAKSYKSIYCEETLDNVFTTVNKNCIKKTTKPIDVLVVDNLNCIKKWDNMRGEPAYAEASNYFRRTALAFGKAIYNESNDCDSELEYYNDVAVDGDGENPELLGRQPVIVLLLTQINRSGGKEASYSGFYPESCIAESVAIERDAKTVIPIYVNQDLIDSNIAMIKLEASRISPAMATATDMPINLAYGKMGEPISEVYIDCKKEKMLRLLKHSKRVLVETASGDRYKAVIFDNKPLPAGYRIIDEENN